MTALPDGDALFTQAAEAEAAFDFQTAHGLYLRAYTAYRLEKKALEQPLLCLVRAGLCIEKSQDWRADSATWEHLGDLLGESIDDHYVHRDRPGQSEMFQIISLDQWEDPYGGYYAQSAKSEVVRHRQAWAYLFAARSSEQAGDFEQAVREYRKSAIAWELGSWGERGHPEIVRPSIPTARTELIIDADPGAKWKLAARCYFRAAYCTIRAYEPRVYNRTFEKYTLRDVRIISLNIDSRHASVVQAASDLDRMERCWARVRESMTEDSKSNVQKWRDVTNLQCQQLLVLEQTLIASGRRNEAKQLFKARQRVMWQHEAARPHKVLRRVYLETTGSGSSVRRTLMSAGFVYLILFPSLFVSLGMISVPPTFAPSMTWIAAVFYSIANIVTLNMVSVTPRGFIGECAQVLEAVSAYFVLGYLLWLVLRWHGD